MDTLSGCFNIIGPFSFKLTFLLVNLILRDPDQGLLMHSNNTRASLTDRYFVLENFEVSVSQYIILFYVELASQ